MPMAKLATWSPATSRTRFPAWATVACSRCLLWSLAATTAYIRMRRSLPSNSGYCLRACLSSLRSRSANKPRRLDGKCAPQGSFPFWNPPPQIPELVAGLTLHRPHNVHKGGCIGRWSCRPISLWFPDFARKSFQLKDLASFTTYLVDSKRPQGGGGGATFCRDRQALA